MAVTLFVDKLWISPYAFTAFVALEEKGVPFEVRPVSLGDGEQHSPAYVELSITSRVPALRHDDFGLAESSAIANYVDEVFPGPPLYPVDLRERARTRQVIAWIRSDLLALREERPTSSMFYARDERAVRPLSERGKAAAAKLMRVAETLVPEGRRTIGSSFSLADSDLAFMLHRLILNGDPVPTRIRRYAEEQWSRPSVMKFVTHERPPFEPYA